MNESLARERRLVRWQALSGLAFGTFLVLHLLNTMVGAFGQAGYDRLQGWLRVYYQFPLVEIVAVALAASIHIVCGLRRMVARRRRAREVAPKWLRFHRASGYFLLVVIAGHALATRGMVLFLDEPVGFSYLTFSLTQWPYLFFPYYFLLFGCGLYHGSQGAIAALGALGTSLPAARGRLAGTILFASFLLGGVGILAMGALLGEVDTGRFEEYREFYREYMPWFLGE